MAAFDSPLTRLEGMLKEIVGEISGTDSNDEIYDSIQELWKKELTRPKRKGKNANGSDWYGKAYEYWEDEETCPLSDDGVLQGYGHLTLTDCRDSNEFLNKIQVLRPGIEFTQAADCGAGIGRVTKHFLLSRFAMVDLVEQSPRLLAASEAYIGEASVRTRRINIGLQDFEPSPGSYDVIWIQWVIGHVHDIDCIRFFERCKAGLRPHGVVILKDNTSEDWTFVVDKSDSSVSRAPAYIILLAKLAGLTLLLKEKQKDFPEDLFPVYMFAFAPTTSEIAVPVDSGTCS